MYSCLKWHYPVFIAFFFKVAHVAFSKSWKNTNPDILQYKYQVHTLCWIHFCISWPYVLLPYWSNINKKKHTNPAKTKEVSQHLIVDEGALGRVSQPGPAGGWLSMCQPPPWEPSILAPGGPSEDSSIQAR